MPGITWIKFSPYGCSRGRCSATLFDHHVPCIEPHFNILMISQPVTCPNYSCSFAGKLVPSCLMKFREIQDLCGKEKMGEMTTFVGFLSESRQCHGVTSPLDLKWMRKCRVRVSIRDYSVHHKLGFMNG